LKISAGSVDENCLVGEKNEDTEEVAKKGFGEWLARAGGNFFYVRNEIKGLTDHLKGMLFLEGGKRGAWRKR